MARRKRKEPSTVWYRLRVIDWSADYSPGLEKHDLPEHLGLQLEVELPEPQKGVERGSLTIYGEAEPSFGCLFDYNLSDDGERILSATVWIGFQGVQGLISCLAAGRSVVLDFLGEPFRYRKARARFCGWYTDGHSAYEDE